MRVAKWGNSLAVRLPSAVVEASDHPAWLEAAQAAGKAVPGPQPVRPIEACSGKFLVRVPRSLHARLARRAAQEGVSLNQFLTGVLAREVGA